MTYDVWYQKRFDNVGSSKRLIYHSEYGLCPLKDFMDHLDVVHAPGRSSNDPVTLEDLEAL